MMTENIRALIAAIRGPEPEETPERAGHFRSLALLAADALEALSVPDTDNQYVREKLFDLIRECDNVEEIVDKLWTAVPALSRDIAGEIEAERLDTDHDAIGADAYINGLIRAEEIARNGR